MAGYTDKGSKKPAPPVRKQGRKKGLMKPTHRPSRRPLPYGAK